jgi:hypothetical protein
VILTAPAFAPALAATPADAETKSSAATVIDHNNRSFRIPFNFDPEQKSEIKEIALIVSEDLGVTWKPVDRTTPDSRAVFFKAPRDGEYWFAVQTISKDGRLYPKSTDLIEPKMKVNVDTSPPKLKLEANPRRGSFASVRWDIRDERLDRGSFALEFQTEGERDWRQVPVKKPVALIGEKTWDAGTAGPVRVRAVVADRAKNTKEANLNLPEGSPENPRERAEASAGKEPEPLGSFVSNESNALPQFPSDPEERSPLPPARQSRAGNNTAAAASAAPSGDYNPFDASSGSKNGGAAPASPVGAKPQLIASPRFNLNYAVDDAGPGGPAIVELWITLDGGRTWSRRGEDPDRTSPFPVDLGGEGTFGLTLVAKSESNLGDQPPGPGDRPNFFVEVDSTPPSVKLEPVKVGRGADAGKIVITWHATDLHLGARPVAISVRGEASTTWQPIGPAMENIGQYVWTVPANAPPKFFVRVDVVDQMGHRNSDETPASSPVIVDRTRPKSRIIGLDPSSRSAAGPLITPIR